MLATRHPGHSASDTLSPQLRGTSAHLDAQQKMARSGSVWCMDCLCVLMKLYIFSMMEEQSSPSMAEAAGVCGEQ